MKFQKSVQNALIVLIISALASWANDPRLHVNAVLKGADTVTMGSIDGVFFKGLFYFPHDDGVNGVELWVTDGTSAGTQMVKNINAGASSNPSNFTVSGNYLYFLANDGSHGLELWRTDGSVLGTVMVEDYNSGQTSSGVHILADLNGWLYFTCTQDGKIDQQMFRTNGTTSVNVDITGALINSGTNINNKKMLFVGQSMIDYKIHLYTVTNSLTAINEEYKAVYGSIIQPVALPGSDTVFFVGLDTNYKTLLSYYPNDWGTSGGVKNFILPSGGIASYSKIAFVNGGIMVDEKETGGDWEPWFYANRSTSESPVKLINLAANGGSSLLYQNAMLPFGAQTLFSAWGANSFSRLFTTDGTVAGTKDACPTFNWAYSYLGTSYQSLASLGGVVLIEGAQKQNTTDTSGIELYSYDGTSCQMAYNFLPGGYSGIDIRALWASESVVYVPGRTSVNALAPNLYRVTRNQAPVMSAVSTQNAKEDALQTFTITVSDVDDPLTSTQIHIAAANSTLIVPNGLTVTGTGATRQVSIQPAAATIGSTTITLVATDGVDSTTQTFALNIAMVNHAPSFSVLSDSIHVSEDDVAYNATWATNVNPGLANEAAQQMHFSIMNDHSSLFTVQPAISSTGVLSFTLAPDSNGIAHLAVVLHDDGGVAYNGVDTSVAKSLTISVAAGNDAPYFVKGDTALVMYSPGSPAQAVLVARDKEQQALNFNVLSARASLLTSFTDSSLTVTWMPTNDTDTISVEVVDALGAKDTVQVIAESDGTTALQPLLLENLSAPVMGYSRGVLWIRSAQAWSGRVSALDAQGRELAARNISVGKGASAIAWPELGAVAFVKGEPNN